MNGGPTTQKSSQPPPVRLRRLDRDGLLAFWDRHLHLEGELHMEWVAPRFRVGFLGRRVLRFCLDSFL